VYRQATGLEEPSIVPVQSNIPPVKSLSAANVFAIRPSGNSTVGTKSPQVGQMAYCRIKNSITGLSDNERHGQHGYELRRYFHPLTRRCAIEAGKFGIPLPLAHLPYDFAKTVLYRRLQGGRIAGLANDERSRPGRAHCVTFKV